VGRALQASALVLPWAWLAGVVFCAGRLGLGLLAARRMRRWGTRAVEADAARMFARVAERIGVRRVVRLLESVLVEAPTVVGWMKPVVLLPACCFTGLTTAQVEALLAHELAHIRRHDYLVSVLQSVVEALLFYHPAAWWVSRQVRRERECCCDEIAAEVAGDRLQYARALSWLEEQRLVGPVVGLGANGGVLHMRIRRLLGYRVRSVASQMGAVAVLCALLLSAGAVAVREARAQRTTEGPGQATLGPAVLVRASSSRGEVPAVNSAKDAAAARQSGDGASQAPASSVRSLDRASLEGVVVDPTGAVMPRVTVAAVNAGSGRREVQLTTENGGFAFSLPEGKYMLEAAAPGFKSSVAQVAQLSSVEPIHMTIKLQIGGISESLKVRASDGPQGRTNPPPNPGGPVRVSAAVMAGAAVSQVPPIYPPDAKANHVQGTVVLSAVISTMGDVEELRVVSGPAELQASALNAVKQWKYRPYLLNGNAVAVTATINVNYSLSGDGAPPPPPIEPGASRQPGRPIRVSAGVMAGQAIAQVAPQYPEDAKAAGVQGTVVLHAVISKEGDIENLQVVSGPDQLRPSALDAVKQWKYKSYLLNGEPVEVETTINVNYSLAE
jgi:TonB family protein